MSNDSGADQCPSPLSTNHLMSTFTDRIHSHLAWSRVGVVLALACLVSTAACESKSRGGDAGTDTQTTTFDSSRAPYRTTIQAGWTRIDAASLNSHADFAATRDETLYLMVIPQSLPQVGEMDPPSASALKEASLDRMSKNVQEFRVEREGPVKLETTEGISVFAEGVSDGTHIQYIATFLTHDSWGYQVVAWGPAYTEDKLVNAVDTFFDGWQFTDESVPSPRPDGGVPSPPERSDASDAPASD